MDRFLVPRALAAGSLLTAATALRAGTACARLAASRTPPLARLAFSASMGGDGSARAQAAFRDELVGLARESAERCWLEMRRGVESLDGFARPPALGPGPARPYRVKP